MKQKLRVFCTLLLLAVASVGWGQTTYKLEQVTSVKSGELYVFEQDGYVMNNTVSANALQTTNTYNSTGLSGTESYIWKLETSGSGFNMRNASLGTSYNYLTNSGSKTDVSLSNTKTTWIFSFQEDGTVVIQQGNTDGRFLGYTSETSHAYKAYAASNLSSASYPHAIKVYQLVEDSGETPTLEDNDLALSGSTALTFDLYNNSNSQTINFTTSSTGAVTVCQSDYITTSVSGNTITVTPDKVTPETQTITVSQAADETYAAGTATFTVTITDSTPIVATNWQKTSLADLSANDIFVIVGNNGENYALANDNGASAAPTAVSVTVSGDYLKGTVADNIKWNVSGNATDGYTFYPNGSTTTWLYCTNTNNGVRVGDNANKTFKISEEGYLSHDGTSRYVGIYSSQDWRCYTSINANIENQTFAFYKYIGAPEPTILANNVEIANDVISGSINYSIGNAVEGGILTASTDAEWLTIGTITSEAVPFTTSANTANTERSATVTLTYTYESKTVTKDVTVTQAAAPLSYTTIPALFEAATKEAKDVKVTFNNWVVSGVSTNGKNVYVTDGTNGFVIFDNGGNLNNTYAVGKVLSGTAVPCKLVLYNGFAEITNINAENLTISDGGNVTVADITLANLAGVNTGAVVSYEGLTCSVNSGKYYLTDGTNTLQVYNSLYTFETLEDGAKYNITGVYQQYNNTKEILPRSADDIVKVEEPSITVASTEIEVVAAGAEATINVTYNNITNVEAEVQFVGADGTTVATYDWIEAEVNDENNISYIVNENTSTEARIAYLKVYALDDNANDVYSDLISITQKGITIDYATLPFTYDGNGQGELPTGLTQSGVASYTSSPSMKFDASGDNLILKMNEAPKVLYFDIKGNSFSGGTFTVQTSTNGTDYTDLATYTELTSDVQTEMFTNIGTDVRYIKWIYTEKKSGNVALGNIIASNEAPETIDVNIGESATGADGAYYSSVYYSDKTLKVPEGVVCLTYKVDGGALTVSKTYSAGDVIPAGEAVVIKASAYGNGTVTFMVAPTTNVKDTESMLLGVDEAKTIDEAGYKYYKLTLNAAKKAGTAGFYFDKGVTDGSSINAAAHKCYLRVPVDQANGAKGFVFGEETDGIGQIENGELTIDNSVVYDLSGRKLNEVSGRHGSLPLQLPKGIYIVNGKKVVVK